MKELMNNCDPATSVRIDLLGEVHPLLQQLGSCDGLTDFGGYSELVEVRDSKSFSHFLQVYQSKVLRRYELPYILRAHGHALGNQARELVALDGEVASLTSGPKFQIANSWWASASRRVGQAHLQRLRPLRDQRLVQRYLAAVDAGDARGWHTIVYGITLAVYSLPVRQGLILYARQVLDGFVRAAARPLGLSSSECGELIGVTAGGVPGLVETLLRQRMAGTAYSPDQGSR